jgi:hypothetical protein
MMHCYESSLQYRPYLLGVTHMVMFMLSQIIRLCVWIYPPREWHARGYGDAAEGTDPASLKARIMLRRLWFGR